jgi:DNA replication and repair protein RecF
LFRIHDQPLKKYGSQGQQKSFLIALKLAKFQFIKNQKGFPPILLLDDIFDKLDSERVSYLLDLIENEDLGQTFITDTDLEKVPKILNSMKIDFKAFEINDGLAVQL